MHKKTIYIPIYQYRLTMIYNKNIENVAKKYKLKLYYDYSAFTFEDDLKHRHIIVAFREKDLSVVAHEIVHIKNYILLGIGANLDLNNDEFEAYLTMYLFDKIYNFLNKINAE